MKVEERPLRDLARIIVYYLFPIMVRLLPPGFDFKLYRKLGRFFYKLGGNKRVLVEKNLSMAFADQDQAYISCQAKEYFENHFIDRLQLFTFPRLNKKNIGCYIRMEGMELLSEALESGKGCIIVHGHFGPAQLFFAAIGLAGFPVTQIGYITKEGYSFIGTHVAVKKRLELEASLPGEIIYADSFLKPVFIKLKMNQVICNAGDGTGGGLKIGKTVMVPFLDIERPFPIGSAALAQRTGAVLLPLLMSKDEDGRYIGEIKKPIPVEQDKHGVVRAVRQFASLFEDQVKKQPGLWHFWDEFPNRQQDT